MIHLDQINFRKFYFVLLDSVAFTLTGIISLLFILLHFRKFYFVLLDSVAFTLTGYGLFRSP